MRRALGIAAAVALTVTTAVPAVAAAQETPTERSAAADVIRRMNELERSLALPQLVARLTARDARRDAVVARARELMDRELLAMADDITRHPEVATRRGARGNSSPATSGRTISTWRPAWRGPKTPSRAPPKKGH